MVYLNYVQLIFLQLILISIFLSGLINLFENKLPPSIVQSLRYGKFSDTKAKSALTVQVPKSWFKHFYIYSSILSTTALYFCVNNYVFEKTPPDWVYATLDFVMGSQRKSSVNSTRILLAMSLLTLQCLRRAYDTHFVSVFGKNARIHLAHYALGFIFYTGCILTILSEAPNFSKFYPAKTVLQWPDLNIKDLFATYLFLWAWYHQYQVTVILANLRKDDKGNVITQAYKLPKGDWFDNVSSPHNFAEILMYSSLTLILWPNFTWWFIYIWVIVNQVETALLSHWWYQEKFEDYPINRKILIPCIY